MLISETLILQEEKGSAAFTLHRIQYNIHSTAYNFQKPLSPHLYFMDSNHGLLHVVIINREYSICNT